MRVTKPLFLCVILCLFVFQGLGVGAGALPFEDARSYNDRYAVPLDALPAATLEATLAASGAELVRIDERLGFAVVKTTAPWRLERALDVPLVHDAEGAGAFVPNDPRYGQQWALATLDMPSAWSLERGSRDVWVAVVDSGVDTQHEDLKDTAFRTGVDYVDLDLNPSDVHGHGTHVAGTIAAGTDNGIGIAGMADVGIIVIRVIGADNRGSCLDFASGTAEAAARGADVINLSLHCNSSQVYLTAAMYFAEASGAVVVASAGNAWQSSPGSCVTTPASHPSVIAVAAIDSNLNAASFSCRGEQVEVAAPGVAVLSTTPRDQYGSWSGTSMAAPHVSGLAALLLSHQDLSNTEVRAILGDTALDLGSTGRDTTFGHGLIQPEAALAAVAGP